VERYRVYGLTVESELEIPELLPAKKSLADVVVTFGKARHRLEGTIAKTKWYQASRREFLMDIAGVARFHVEDGRRITIELSADAEQNIRAADVRLWLLGSAFGALLHQRGLLPLHVSAVKAPSGVWAFTGPSGEGKSTLAGFLQNRFGWTLVSDDVSVVDTERSRAFVHPGPQKLKLWADALQYLDFPNCSKVRDLSNTNKFQLYFSNDNGYDSEALRGLVMLDSLPETEAPRVERLRGSQAFGVCMKTIYRPSMENWFKRPEDGLKQLSQLCGKVPIYRFSRPRSLMDIERHMAPLLQLIANPNADD
jgi:hypothetical protein